MFSPFHHHRASSQTHGLVLNWGRFYDLAMWLLARFAFGRSEQALRQNMLAFAQLQPGEIVLDVGCGTGSLALEARCLVGERGRVCGIDPGPRQIARAQSKAEQARFPIDFQIGVIEHLPFADQTFDVVLSTLMMHHLPGDLKQAGLAEIARVLKPGGRLLILDMKDLADERALTMQAGFSPMAGGETGLRGFNFVLASIVRKGQENAS